MFTENLSQKGASRKQQRKKTPEVGLWPPHVHVWVSVPLYTCKYVHTCIHAHIPHQSIMVHWNLDIIRETVVGFRVHLKEELTWLDVRKQKISKQTTKAYWTHPVKIISNEKEVIHETMLLAGTVGRLMMPFIGEENTRERDSELNF